MKTLLIILYGGVALFGALGALVTGVIWKHYDAQSAIVFSLLGMGLMFVVYLMVLSRAKKNV